MKRALQLACVSLVFALQGCELALIGAGGAAAVSAFDRRTASAIYQDESMALSIRDRIGGRFGSLTNVNVAPYNRMILLTGEAPDEATRAAIEADVRGIANIRSIVNDIQIAPVSSLAQRTNDAFITSKIKGRYLDSGKVNPVHVRVVTEAGVVYLLGLVTEKEADDAVEIARTTGGVRKVVKVFDYCQPSDEACRPQAKPPAENPKPAA
jgi:osmotically-inducible protein OsmY